MSFFFHYFFETSFNCTLSLALASAKKEWFQTDYTLFFSSSLQKFL